MIDVERIELLESVSASAYGDLFKLLLEDQNLLRLRKGKINVEGLAKTLGIPRNKMYIQLEGLKGWLAENEYSPG